LYWNQLLNRVRTLRKQLVLFKIDSTGVKRLSVKIDDIKRDYVNGATWLSNADLQVQYGKYSKELVLSPWAINCIYIEQALRYCGLFGVYFKKWRKKSGATFDYLKIKEPIEVCKESKKTSKEIQAEKKEEAISRIVLAPILTDQEYESKKNENSDEVKRYGYCNFNGIKHGPLFTYVDEITTYNRNEYRLMPLDVYKQFANDGSSHKTEQRAKEAIDNYKKEIEKYNTQLEEHNRRLKLHMLQYYQRDQSVTNFCYMLFDNGDNQEDQFKSFNVKRSIYNKIILALGFESFQDERIFSESAGIKINEDAIKTIMEAVALNERLSTELEIKKAKGDPYIWIKYVFNKMGRDLGIAGGKVKLMSGDEENRKWSIRGIGTSKDNDLFKDMLELAYMRCSRHRRRKEAEVKQSIDTYNRWLVEKFTIIDGGCRYKCGNCKLCNWGIMDDDAIEDTHKEYVEKYTKMNYEGDAELFEKRSHHWDEMLEDRGEYLLKTNFIWRNRCWIGRF